MTAQSRAWLTNNVAETRLYERLRIIEPMEVRSHGYEDCNVSTLQAARGQ